MHPSQAPARPVTILICDTCRDRRVSPPLAGAGAALAAATAAAVGDRPIRVETTSCLANCQRGLSAAIRVAGGWTYVFGGLTSEDADALVAGAGMIEDNGKMTLRGRPAALKQGLITRLPPLAGDPS